ncbi:MAG: winged helix-turn-helix transcriptional regulator [Burkholderiaceae bacterium]|nr:winged helix-turn-helix transcriptional regulator [Burkholderiaceae bacterium]
MLNYQFNLDRVFHALSDPTRRAIVERLTHGEAAVSQLAEPLAMSLPAVVQHIQVLEESGVVRTKKTGRVRTCKIDLQVLSTAEQWITQRRNLWEQRFDLLGAVLEENLNKE